jgi:hypothetical protein
VRLRWRDYSAPYEARANARNDGSFEFEVRVNKYSDGVRISGARYNCGFVLVSAVVEAEANSLRSSPVEAVFSEGAASVVVNLGGGRG